MPIPSTSTLDEILNHLEIVSDAQVPTRGDNVLDITLANDNAINGDIKCKVVQKLNSDHNPTHNQIQLKNPQMRTG